MYTRLFTCLGFGYNESAQAIPDIVGLFVGVSIQNITSASYCQSRIQPIKPPQGFRHNISDESLLQDRGNGSDAGWWTIHTGQDDIEKINTIQNWNGKTSVDYWNEDFANMINGTDAASWHPFIKRKEKLPIFSSDICR